VVGGKCSRYGTDNEGIKMLGQDTATRPRSKQRHAMENELTQLAVMVD
jgi:hypothetical protein